MLQKFFFWKAFEWVLKPQKKTVWIGRLTPSLWQCKGTRLWKYYRKKQQRPIHRWINKSLSLSKFLSSGRLLKDFVHVIITNIVLWGENSYIWDWCFQLYFPVGLLLYFAYWPVEMSKKFISFSFCVTNTMLTEFEAGVDIY